jgi:hypothetical protein
VRLEEILSRKFVLMSNAGVHAGETLAQIIARKREDLANCGHTVWAVNSNLGTPDRIQSFCEETDERYVIFVAPKSKNTGGPKTFSRALAFSADKQSWKSFSPKMGHVTGYIKSNTTGLWLCELKAVTSSTIDFSQFEQYGGSSDPFRFWPSDNAIPAQRKSSRSGNPKQRDVVVPRQRLLDRLS